MRQPTTNMSMAAIPYLRGELRQVGEGAPRLSHHSTRTETIECMSVSMLATQWSRCQKLQTFSPLSEFSAGTGVRRRHHFVSVNVSKATLMHD
jgi:hypothetical protein